MKRRSVLVSLGTIVAGGGAALGTGAFSSVEAERTVTVETAGDANAFLALTPASGASDYVDDTGDTIVIDISGNSEGATGVNQNSLTSFDALVTVTNQGTNDVDSVTLTIQGDNGEGELLTPNPTSFGDGDFPDNGDASVLAPGETVSFGLEIELRADQINDTVAAYDNGDIDSANFEPTILIEATTA
ncbi:Protein of unknown function (DUF1102) [Natrinema pellirubrum DSM 15624]|uniref:DUF1102 domain-containing protein n=1 Tax=Natrinema pellirubrum (strain DSM 15624 / CIP 106293 / JCM 10476 / NCIMB 786 / 157) TaxID=797303 RepID=L0JG30_NATP1|nr:DUF1102 domain-containing protein [Natrinema pellirubrum]AGB30264.1 Protein of unknown function (DUF1102) [Natrinema pellirubrum DSM 15624]